MSIAEFDADTVVDASECILGRVASNVAQMAMDGERVAVVNAERAVVTGREESTMEKYRARAEIGSDQGPAYPKRPDMIFKRSVRGMLPHRTSRGSEAFGRVRVYVGNPHDYDGDRLEGTELDRLSNIRFTSLGSISEELGGEKTW